MKEFPACKVEDENCWILAPAIVRGWQFEGQ